MLISQREESLVCEKSIPVTLRYPNGVNNLRLYSIDDNREFVQGQDYILRDGQIIRCDQSAIADFSQAPLYGIKPFDHELIPNWGNAAYMIYADYDAQVEPEHTVEYMARVVSEKNGNLQVLRKFLQNFGADILRIAVYGDSISTGCEATDMSRAYFSLFCEEICKQYGISAQIINHSVGGEGTDRGILRLDRVMDTDAHILLLAYGMNDQNQTNGKQAVPPEVYRENIRTILLAALEKKMIPILISPCIPHENWIHTSGRMQEYVACLQELSKEYAIPFADVYSLWLQELHYKKSDDLLRNGINHPSNYGHQLYAAVLKSLL